MHDHGSHQWHGVHVHGDSDECVGYRFGLDGFVVRDSVDCSWCTNISVGDIECEWSVGCVLDRTFVDWWCCDHGLHGHSVHLDRSADTGVVSVGESVHDHGSHQWHLIHVHGDGDERIGYWCSFDCFGLGDSVDCSWCTNISVGDVECEWSVGCFLDCSGFDWWCCDHRVHGDAIHLDRSSDAGFVCSGESVHDHGSHEWHGVHVHGDSDERVGYGFSFDGFGFGDSFDGSWCADFGFGDVECEWSVGCFLDCAR